MRNITLDDQLPLTRTDSLKAPPKSGFGFVFSSAAGAAADDFLFIFL